MTERNYISTSLALMEKGCMLDPLPCAPGHSSGPTSLCIAGSGAINLRLGSMHIVCTQHVKHGEDVGVCILVETWAGSWRERQLNVLY